MSNRKSKPFKKPNVVKNVRKPIKTDSTPLKLDNSLLNISLDRAKEELINLVRTKSIFEANQVLPSGKITDYYLDMKESLLSARGAFFAAAAVLHNLKDEVEAIGGSINKTYSLAVGVSMLSLICGQELDTFLVREHNSARTQGHSRWVEGPLQPGARVCIVHDEIVSGTNVIETIRKVQEEADVQIVQVIAIVDRLDGARLRLQEYGVDYTAIMTMSDLVEPAYY